MLGCNAKKRFFTVFSSQGSDDSPRETSKLLFSCKCFSKNYTFALFSISLEGYQLRSGDVFAYIFVQYLVVRPFYFLPFNFYMFVDCAIFSSCRIISQTLSFFCVNQNSPKYLEGTCSPWHRFGQVIK